MSNCSATDKSDTMQIITLTMSHFAPIFLRRSLKIDAHQFLWPTAGPQGPQAQQKDWGLEETSLLVQSFPLQQGHLQPCSQDPKQIASEYGFCITSLSTLCHCMVTLTLKKCFLMFRRTSHVPVCAHSLKSWLRSCPKAPLPKKHLLLYHLVR